MHVTTIRRWGRTIKTKDAAVTEKRTKKLKLLCLILK